MCRIFAVVQVLLTHRISIYDEPEPIAQLCQAGNRQNGKSKARESEASWNINIWCPPSLSPFRAAQQKPPHAGELQTVVLVDIVTIEAAPRAESLKAPQWSIWIAALDGPQRLQTFHGRIPQNPQICKKGAEFQTLGFGVRLGAERMLHANNEDPASVSKCWCVCLHACVHMRVCVCACVVAGVLPRVSQGLFFWMQMSYLQMEKGKSSDCLKLNTSWTIKQMKFRWST